MNNILELRKEIEKGRLGKNIGISTGLPKLDSIIYGIQRRYLYLVGSDSGAGKSSFVIDVFLYNLIKNKENKDISILLYSFEMSTSVVYAKILSLYLWDTFNIVITYENILSLTESLSDENYFYVQKGLDWLDEIQSHIRNVCLINKLSSFAFIVCDKDLNTLKNNNQIVNLSYPVYKHTSLYSYNATSLRAALFENARLSDLVSISKPTKNYLERKWSSIRNSVLLEVNNPKQTDKTVKHKWYHKKPFIIFVNIFKRIFY